MDVKTLQYTARFQGWYYLLSGAWPLVHGRSFQAISGFKADFWLAQTVGALLAVSGCYLLLVARARRFHPETVVLAVGEAAVLAVVDLVCVPLPGTTPVYWLDALVELGFLTGWAWGLRSGQPSR